MVACCVCAAGGEGHRISIVDTRDPWVEVDTPEDYGRAKTLFGLWNPDPNPDLS